MTVWLDGPMGSVLLARGIADVFGANLTAGALVRDTHQSYIEAGADILLTNTLTAAAEFARDEPRAQEGVLAALEHVRGHRAYFSLGPAPLHPACLAAVRAAYTNGAVAGAWLETFLGDDPRIDAWLAALAGVPTVLTTVTPTLPRRGLAAFGANCGTAPLGAPARPPVANSPFVWKPATRLGDERLSVRQIAAIAKDLEVDWIGLCCGGTAAQLFELRKAYIE